MRVMGKNDADGGGDVGDAGDDDVGGGGDDDDEGRGWLLRW